MGQEDPTTSEAWSGPNIGGPAHTLPNFGNVKKSVTDVSAMSPDVGHCIPFQPIKRQSDLFSGPCGGLILHVVYFYLLIEVLA